MNSRVALVLVIVETLVALAVLLIGQRALKFSRPAPDQNQPSGAQASSQIHMIYRNPRWSGVGPGRHK